MTDSLRYDSRTVLLHWLTAGMIAFNWIAAQLVDAFGKASEVWPRSLHILVGSILTVVIVGRLLWRNTGGRSLPPAETGWKELAARAAHWSLYALLLAILGFGLAYELMRGDDFFTLVHIPRLLPVDRAVRSSIRGYHELATNMLLIVAGVHAVAALTHHYVWKDGVLRRMTVG